MKTAIAIARPCHENWNSMHVETGGRHCDSCEKVVKDFSQMNDAELISYLQNGKKNECGRFREDQVFSKKSSFFYNFKMRSTAFVAVLLAKMFNPFEAKAQDAPTTLTVGPDNNAIHKNVYGDSVVYHVNGVLTERKTGDPLRYATIEVRVNNKPASGSVYSDGDGKFELNIAAANSDDQITLIFRKRRHKTYTIKNYTPDGQLLQVRLHKPFKLIHRHEHYLMGAYATF